MRAALLLGLAAAVIAPEGRAQEFAAAAPAPARSASALLECGLPPAGGGAGAEFLAIRWLGLAELTTRAAVGALGLGAGRVALGWSQTGEGDLAWSAAAVGLGVVHRTAGAGVRVLGRHAAAEPGDRPARGIEAGAGAWARGGAFEAWGAAPQMWVAGEAPPLTRWLELGAVWRRADLAVWASRTAVPGGAGGMRGEHEAGIATGSGGFTIWLTARDRPLRGGFGVAARARGLRVAIRIDDHPVLDDTVRLALGLDGVPAP